MFLKHLSIACLALGLVLAGTAHAKTYALAGGSGGQLHIGNGLNLPVQTAAGQLSPPATGNVFPPLLVKKAPGATVQGTTVMASNQRITVPPNVLAKSAGGQQTVGVFFSNPGLYAVGSNMNFVWPTAPAVFSEAGGPRPTPNATVTLASGGAGGSFVRYSPRVAGKRFGGAGRFALSPAAGAPQGYTAGPITVFAIAVPGAGNPPCAHTAFGGANPACQAVAVNAYPTGPQAPGGPAFVTATTPGAPQPVPQAGPGAFGPGPLKPTRPTGTVSAFVLAGSPPAPVSLAALSTGFPWTTAKLTVSAPLAGGAGEKFVITGNDLRTAGGAGTIQMVAGSLSTRNVVGFNANRAWLRLVLKDASLVPALSPWMLVLLMTGLATVGMGIAMRSRRQTG